MVLLALEDINFEDNFQEKNSQSHSHPQLVLLHSQSYSSAPLIKSHLVNQDFGERRPEGHKVKSLTISLIFSIFKEFSHHHSLP